MLIQCLYNKSVNTKLRSSDLHANDCFIVSSIYYINRMSLTICFLAALSGVIAFPSSSGESNVVSYSGFQVWAITPSTNEENEFLIKISKQYGNQNLFQNFHIKIL